MLISVKISRNSAFLGSVKPRVLFFPPIHVKLPTVANSIKKFYNLGPLLTPLFAQDKAQYSEDHPKLLKEFLLESERERELVEPLAKPAILFHPFAAF